MKFYSDKTMERYNVQAIGKQNNQKTRDKGVKMEQVSVPNPDRQKIV